MPFKNSKQKKVYIVNFSIFAPTFMDQQSSSHKTTHLKAQVA